MSALVAASSRRVEPHLAEASSTQRRCFLAYTGGSVTGSGHPKGSSLNFFVGVVAAGLACLPFVGLAALCDAATSARRERTLALSGLGASNLPRTVNGTGHTGPSE